VLAPHAAVRIPADLVAEVDVLVAELRETWWERPRESREALGLGWRRPTRTSLLVAATRQGLRAMQKRAKP